MSSTEPGILLIAADQPNLSFRLPPLFRRAGWAVDLLCLAGHPMVHSRHIRTAIQEKNLDSFFCRLQDILRAPQRPWSVVVVADELLTRRLIATGEADLLKNWQPGALNPRVSQFLFSKFGLTAARHVPHLTLPPGRICHTLAEIQEFGAETGWPIIVKPPGEAGGQGLLKFHSPAELAAGEPSFSLPILAQKYIQGRCGVTEMLCSSGRPLAWLASYFTRRCNGEFSPSTARLFRAMPELQPMVEAVAQFTRFEGFCGFDWMEEAVTGRYYLIEFHPRASTGFRFARFCRVDFPAAVSAWLKSEADSFPVQVQSPDHSLAAHFFPSDLSRCLRQRDWRGLRAWLPANGIRHDVYWDDVPLFVTWSLQRGRKFIKEKMVH